MNIQKLKATILSATFAVVSVATYIIVLALEVDAFEIVFQPYDSPYLIKQDMK